MTIKGIDLSPILSALIAMVAGALTYLAKKIANAQDASAQKSKAETAMIRLGAIGLAMAGDLWDSFSKEFQLRIADGAIGPEDRDAFRQMINEKIELYTSADELKKIAEALGLPLPGIIAKVAEFIIDRLAKAHDPINSDVSRRAYPVRGEADPEVRDIPDPNDPADPAYRTSGG